MSTEENKALVRRWTEEGFGKGNLDLVDELFGPGYVNHSPLAGQASDREGLRQTAATLRAAFPDLHLTIEDMVAEGDRVVLRDTVSGTHRGEFAGIPPTGKRMAVTRIGIFRIADGKIAEYWGVVDMLGMMQQIGAIPAPEEA